MKGTHYTRQQMIEVRQMHEDGASPDQIADYLGRSRKAVLTLLQEMGLSAAWAGPSRPRIFTWEADTR